jgi:hypothetical protein
MTCSENTCGTGIGSVILPGDPDNNSILTATSTFGGIEVSWTMPSTNAHGVAYTKVWRGLTSDFDSALHIADAAGDRFFDRSDLIPGILTTFHYWIQFVSINGTVNALIGPASAIPRQTIDQIIESLSAKIDYGLLSASLKSTVDKADLYKIAQDVANASIQGEQISIRNAVALVQADVENAFVLISLETEARQSAGNAFASQINTLAVSTGEHIATVQTTMEAFVNDLDNKVGALYTAKLTVDGLVGGFGIYNDGTEVEAGFDVDTFWVGRTQLDKKKPFIISGGEVFINQAVIQEASIDIAKIDKATIQNLSALNADMGTLTAGKILFEQQGDPTSYTVIDAASQSLQVWNAGVLRVKIGKLS